MIRAWATCVACHPGVGLPERTSRACAGIAPLGFEPRPVEYPPPSEHVPTAALSNPETPEPPEPRGRPESETEEEEAAARPGRGSSRPPWAVPNDCVRDFVASGQSDDPSNQRRAASCGRLAWSSSLPRTAAGLSAAALHCIRQRVGTVVLESIGRHRRRATASTVIEIKYQPPVIVESDPGVPEPQAQKRQGSRSQSDRTFPPSGKPIQGGTDRPIEGGNGQRPRLARKGSLSPGPKPRAIDGYEVDENAQEWR